MKGNINTHYHILSLAAVITLFLTYILPSCKINEFSKSFGFPCGWFIVYNNTIGDSIVNSTAVNVGLFVNIAIWYYIISNIYKVYRKFRYSDKIIVKNHGNV